MKQIRDYINFLKTDKAKHAKAPMTKWDMYEKEGYKGIELLKYLLNLYPNKLSFETPEDPYAYMRPTQYPRRASTEAPPEDLDPMDLVEEFSYKSIARQMIE
jgi:hypothetical protein